MTGTTRIPKAELTGVRGRLVKLFTRRMFGTVPEPAEVMWHHPSVVMDSSALGRKVDKKWNVVDANLKTFAHMAVASLVGCAWCLDFNYFHAHHKGLDEVKAREVPRWRDSAVFTPQERRVLEYAEAMSQTPPTVTDELVEGLLADLGPAGVVELTAVIGFANFSTRGNIALGVEGQGFAASCNLQPLAQPTTAATAAPSAPTIAAA
jgi:AhpD family alkylhydroperoxidase